MAVIHVTKDNYQQVINSDYAVVDFYGTHCGPCKMLAPIYQELADDLGLIAFGKMCTDEEYDFTKTLGIQYVPTVRFYRNGVQVDEFAGYKDRKELDAYIAKLLYE